MLPADDLRAELECLVHRLGQAGLAHLLAQAVRLCPRCGTPGVVRTSRRRPRGRLQYLRCPQCKWRFKAVVSPQHLSAPQAKQRR